MRKADMLLASAALCPESSRPGEIGLAGMFQGGVRSLLVLDSGIVMLSD